MIDLKSDNYYMKEALKQANLAFEQDEVPVGAIIVAGDQIISRAHNLTEKLTDVTAHAEIQAITAASEFLGSKYLKNCSLYVTLEPCAMCAGALAWSQIDKVVYGAADPKRGAGNYKNIYHPKTKVISGVLEEESREIIQTFFKGKR
jgi:tRNA(adenine34) deaminase